MHRSDDGNGARYLPRWEIVSHADLSDRVIVQRTSAGTNSVVAARRAARLWCTSLVCATATARAVNESAAGPPTYLITDACRCF